MLTELVIHLSCAVLRRDYIIHLVYSVCRLLGRVTFVTRLLLRAINMKWA